MPRFAQSRLCDAETHCLCRRSECQAFRRGALSLLPSTLCASRGSRRPRGTPTLKAVLQTLNATVKGYVNNLDQEYNETACVVCPVLFGAGVKVKTIDAIAMGQIVITNSKGIEGTELVDKKHLLVADKAEKLAEICAEVLLDREKYTTVSECGLEYVRYVHSIKHQASLIDEALNRLY